MQPLGWPKEILKRIVKSSTIGFDCGWHVTRYTMYRQISGFLSRGDHFGRVLSVSESDSLVAMLNAEKSHVVNANYPEYNLLSLPFESDSFDYVLCDQVLEHVEGAPQTAVDEQYRVLKPGGWLILTTCLLNPIHSAPGDYWRFTPDGLRHLCRSFSALEQVDGWGNGWVHLMHWLGVRGMPIPNNRFHPLNWIATRNDPTQPVMTWVIARK